MINHKHKFIYLHTPKTGGMSIGSALYEALGIKDIYQSFHIHYDDLNEEILRDYFVFTFVRNPWDRIVSDYRYKEEINANFSFESFSNNPQFCYEQQYKTSVKPTDINFFDNHKDTSNYFSEFIHTISQLDFLKGKFNHNIDTLPFINFTGRYENIEQDFKYICDKIGITAKLPHKNFTNWKNKHYSWYFKNMNFNSDIIKDSEKFNYTFERKDISSKVDYWFEDFRKYKPFDIVEYDDVVDTYLNVSNKLKPDYDKSGWNERPINSDTEDIDENKNWDGFDPVYYNIDPTKEGIVMAKADTISMNMLGYGESWTHFIYLTLPSQLITKYMTQVHDNKDISIAKKFIREVEETYGSDGWKYNNWKKVEAKFDKNYPEFSSYTDAYETHKCLKWKQDFDIAQYISIYTKGLLFPICYNDKDFMLRRGTHRAFLLSMTGSDVPIILQYDKRKGIKQTFEVNTPEFFGGKCLKMIVDLEKQSQEYYIEGKKIVI